MLRDGLIGWLVLAANGQPYKALFTLYEPTIPPHSTYVSQIDYGQRPEEGTLHHASYTSSWCPPGSHEWCQLVAAWGTTWVWTRLDGASQYFSRVINPFSLAKGQNVQSLVQRIISHELRVSALICQPLIKPVDHSLCIYRLSLQWRSFHTSGVLELGLSVSPIQNGLCLFPQGRALLMAFILLSFLLFHHFSLIYRPRGAPWIRKEKKEVLTDAHKVFKLEKQYSKYSSTCNSDDMVHTIQEVCNVCVQAQRNK